MAVPGNLARLFAALVAAAAIAMGVWNVPAAFTGAENRRAATAGLTRGERLFLPARSTDLALEPYTVGLQQIPPDATYAVLTGPGVRFSNPVGEVTAVEYAPMYLLPRRQTGDPKAADWIVSIGADLRALHLRFRRVLPIIPGTPGYELAEVDR